MNKGDSLKLQYAWWNTNRPGPLASTGLGAALKEYEKNKGRHGLALAALEKVEAARLKGIKACLGPAFADTKSALQRDAALKTAITTHTTAITKSLTKIEASITTLERNIPKAQKLYSTYSKAPESKDGLEARKSYNMAGKIIGDNLTSADTNITELFQQKAALEHNHAIWTRVTAAKATLEGLKPDASNIRKHAQDV